MRKSIVFILTSLCAMALLSAETVLAEKNINVSWNLSGIEFDEGVSVAFEAIGDSKIEMNENGKSTLVFDISGMYGVGQFKITYQIRSRYIANLYLSSNGILKNDDGSDSLSWTLQRENSKSWEEILTSENEDKKIIIDSHYPSVDGILTKERSIEFKIQTENLLNREKSLSGPYSTVFSITWEGTE